MKQSKKNIAGSTALTLLGISLGVFGLVSCNEKDFQPGAVSQESQEEIAQQEAQLELSRADLQLREESVRKQLEEAKQLIAQASQNEVNTQGKVSRRR